MTPRHIRGTDGKTYLVSSKEEVEDLMLSGVIAAATGSAIIGGLVGGSYLAGVVGDIIGDNEGFGIEDLL